MIKNLILSGGALRGYLYIGMLKCLEEFELLDTIDNIIGCSIGSLFATLIISNYCFEELKKVVYEFKMTNFIEISSDNILNFFETLGLIDTFKLEKFIDNLIYKKCGKMNCTFIDLYEYNNKLLTITVTCLNTQNIVYYNYNLTPEFVVSKSIIMSMAIPFLFQPIRINDRLYVDGGLLNNHPIHLIEEEDYKNTLLVVFKMDALTKTRDSVLINTFEEYVINIIKLLVNNTKFYEIIKEKFDHNNILIIKSNIKNPYNFDVSNEDITRYILQGYSQTCEYLKKHYNL